MDLPILNIEDKDAAYEAVQFLPKNPVILEAGMCTGEDTLRFKEIWPDCTIIGFEPHPELFDIAQKNTKDIPSMDIRIFNYALSDKEGVCEFFCSETMPAASSLFCDNTKNVVLPDTVKQHLVDAKAEDTEHMRSYKDKIIEVKCVSIDEMLKCLFLDFTYMWLDAEGAELSILRGAEKTLETVKVINIEMNRQEFRKGMALMDETCKFIFDHGFRCHGIWQAHENWQTNGIFVKEQVCVRP